MPNLRDAFQDGLINGLSKYTYLLSPIKEPQHIPPLGFKNIKIINNTINVRDLITTDDWTDTGSATMLNNAIGNYMVLYEINNTDNKEVFYVYCGPWNSYSVDMSIIFVSEAPFTVKASDWQGASAAWYRQSSEYNDTGIHIATNSILRCTSFTSENAIPKYYGTGTPSQYYSQIVSDFMEG